MLAVDEDKVEALGSDHSCQIGTREHAPLTDKGFLGGAWSEVFGSFGEEFVHSKEEWLGFVDDGRSDRV